MGIPSLLRTRDTETDLHPPQTLHSRCWYFLLCSHIPWPKGFLSTGHWSSLFVGLDHWICIQGFGSRWTVWGKTGRAHEWKKPLKHWLLHQADSPTPVLLSSLALFVWSFIICDISPRRRVNIHHAYWTWWMQTSYLYACHFGPIRQSPCQYCRSSVPTAATFHQHLQRHEQPLQSTGMMTLIFNPWNWQLYHEPDPAQSQKPPTNLQTLVVCQKIRHSRCHQASFLGQEYLFLGGILCKQVGLSYPVDQNAAFLD